MSALARNTGSQAQSLRVRAASAPPAIGRKPDPNDGDGRSRPLICRDGSLNLVVA
jgi:hypothetical protein